MEDWFIDRIKDYTSWNYVFGSVGDYVVVYRRIPDTRTNENKDTAFHTNSALFRANIMMVESIIHKFNTASNPEKIYDSKRREYHVGKVITRCYDTNPNNTCSDGIYFYRTPEPAWFEGVHSVENGRFLSWYNSGQLRTEAYYRNGVLDGSFTIWYETGRVFTRGEYTNGEKSGNWYEYRDNLDSTLISTLTYF